MNCPNATAPDPTGHSLLLEYGLIRIMHAVPADAEFTLTVVHDPYGCALAVDPASGQLMASVYRRPLPTTNLRFLSAVMFDGRETVQPLTTPYPLPPIYGPICCIQRQTATSIHFQADRRRPRRN